VNELDSGIAVRTENDAVIQIAQEAARAQAGAVPVEPGKMYVFPTADGFELLDLDDGIYTDRLPAPQRKKGTTTVEDVDSFAAYYRKHADEHTEVYVSITGRRICAVLDAHTPDAPRWGEHHLVLQLKTTKAWGEWTGMDRKTMGQTAFAEFVEDHLADIREPAAAELLEIASTFQAKTKVTFASALALPGGDRKLVWEESTDASAGTRGQLQVPTMFKVALTPLELPVPEGGERVVYGLAARFRYRIQGGSLHVLYLLDDPAPILRDAMLDVVKQVETALGITVLRGTPA
jgi:uncharacterized protein YfdQ (DUF2303 family)